MEQMEQEELQGFLLINKPTGMTSFFCIKKIHAIIGRKIKIGHAGTLDSFATGLLIIAVGRPATRLVSLVMKLDKRYVATGKLGQLTDTLDFTGELIEDIDPPKITQEQLSEALALFGKGYTQVPPIYSALKYEGRPLSKLARSGKLSQQELEEIVQKKGRKITLYELTVQEVKLPFFTVYAHVSHGTYIRSLIDDIAQKLGTHATTHELSRSHIGPFAIEKAIDLNAIDSLDDIKNNLLSIEEVQSVLVSYAYKQV